MGLTSFCGILTLQVGVAILAAVYFTLAAVILAANIFGHIYDHGSTVGLILMVIFVILLVIAGILMLASSYSESRPLALVALIVIIIALCYWLILGFLSMLSSGDVARTVCIFSRCPETFWIANLRYRTKVVKEVDEEYSDSVEHTTESMTPHKLGHRLRTSSDAPKGKRAVAVPLNSEKQILTFDALTDSASAIQSTNEIIRQNISYVDEPPLPLYVHARKLQFVTPQNVVITLNKPITTNTSSKKLDESLLSAFTRYYFLDSNDTAHNDTTQTTTTESGEKSTYVVGQTMIGAIIISIINLIFFLFSAFVMWSWAQELDWSDYYVEDEPVIIYEEEY